MFDFFIALFGGIHYSSKILSEKVVSNRAQRSFEARDEYRRSRLALWALDVAAPSMEEDLKYFIADPRNYEEVWKEVHEAYQQMPTHKSYINDSSIYENHHLVYSDNTLSIMLARRGKVRKCNVIDGATLALVPRGSSQFSKEKWDSIFEFWVYIRDELRRHGVDAKLVFKTGLFGEDNECAAYDADDVDKFHYLAGRLTWLPLTNYDENLQYIRV